MVKTISYHKLVKKEEKIAIGISGGKDSLLLFYLLFRKGYKLLPVHVQVPFVKSNLKEMKEWIRRFGVELTVINHKGFEFYNHKKACFYCSLKRRMSIFDWMDKNGINTVAFAHHKDDVIETFFLNLFYHGELASILPIQALFDGRVKVIRPLYYFSKKDVNYLCSKTNISSFVEECPYENFNKRELIRNLYFHLDSKIKDNIFNALNNINYEYMPVYMK